MKKIAVFILIQLFAVVVAAAELPSNEAAGETVSPENTEKIYEEKLDSIYSAPTLGLFAGLLGWGASFSINADFLIKNTNIYLGLDTGFSYRITEFFDNMASDSIFMRIPARANIAFGLPSGTHPNVKFTAIWFSAGIDLWINSKPEYDDDGDMENILVYLNKYDGYSFILFPNIGIGVDLVLKYSLVLRIGIDYCFYMMPDLVVGLGYKF